MRIGDLPRARSAGRPIGRSAVGALFVVAAIGSAVAGWQVLPVAREGESPTGISTRQDTTPVAQIPSAARHRNAVQVADAEATIPYASPPHHPGSGAKAAASDAAAPRVPAKTDSNPAAASRLPMDAPDPRPPETPAPSPSAAVAAPGTPEATGTIGMQAALAPEPDQPSGLVDLNTGSFEELNTLENGGPIGRAIIRGRPYASTEELVTKKVLRRSVYEKVKDQVTVQ